MKHPVVLGAALMLVATAASAQTAPADPAVGLTAAKRWCADCHVIAGDQRGAGPDAAPTWTSLMRDPAVTPGGLRQFLLAPHRGMPNLQLSRQDIDDIVAYMLTLRSSGGGP